MGSQITVCEMSARDGMQILNRKQRVSQEARLQLIEALQRLGVKYIEIGSFVNPEQEPAMADTAELAAKVPAYAGQLAVLVPNTKYYRKLVAAKLDHVNSIAVFLAIPEEFSRHNVGKSAQDALREACAATLAARRDGRRVRAHVSGAFRDLTPNNRETPASEVAKFCDALIEAGCEVVSLADTDGNALPGDIARIISYLGARFDVPNQVGVHLHDKDNKGMVNAWVAYEQGVRIFDASVGGIGGNQRVKPHEIGNIATDDLADFFEGVGITTGINFKAMLEAGQIICKIAAEVGERKPPSKWLTEKLAATHLINECEADLPASSPRRKSATVPPALNFASENNKGGGGAEINDPNYQAFLSEAEDLARAYPDHLVAYANGRRVAIGKDARELSAHIPSLYWKQALFITTVPQKELKLRRPLRIFPQ